MLTGEPGIGKTALVEHLVPTYLGTGDPAGRFTNYYPARIRQAGRRRHGRGLAARRRRRGCGGGLDILVTTRGLHDRQAVNFAGPCGDNSFVENATAVVRGAPIASVVVVTLDAAGRAQHVAAGDRPLSSVLLLSRLLGQRFAGTSYAEYSLTGEP